MSDLLSSLKEAMPWGEADRGFQPTILEKSLGLGSGGAASSYPGVQPEICLDDSGKRIDQLFDCHERSGVTVCETDVFEESSNVQRSDYFINGVWNKICDAMKSTLNLANRNGRDVKLIHNETQMEGRKTWLGKISGGARDLANAFGGIVGDWIGGKAEPAVQVQTEMVLEDVKRFEGAPYKITLEAHSQGTIIQDNSLEGIREGLELHDRNDWKEFGERHLRVRRYGEAIHNSEHALPEFTERYDYKGDLVYRGTKPLGGVIDLATAPADFVGDVREGVTRAEGQSWWGKTKTALFYAWSNTKSGVADAWSRVLSEAGSEIRATGSTHGFSAYMGGRANMMADRMIQMTAEIDDPKEKGEKLAQEVLSYSLDVEIEEKELDKTVVALVGKLSELEQRHFASSLMKNEHASAMFPKAVQMLNN